METWTLLRWRLHSSAAEAFWHGIRRGVASLEPVGAADLQAAWTIGRDFADRDFSLVDRTSFAVMERLGLERAASFDDDFAVYRWGPRCSIEPSTQCFMRSPPKHGRVRINRRDPPAAPSR